ncbi:MAG: hypothetical protein VYA17_08090 [Pseudomonadota bacterium]|nr:hypothetical protein [Pseudomonadota bacterium]
MSSRLYLRQSVVWRRAKIGRSLFSGTIVVSDIPMRAANNLMNWSPSLLSASQSENADRPVSFNFEAPLFNPFCYCSTQVPVLAVLSFGSVEIKAEIILETAKRAVTPRRACILYDGRRVLRGE